MYGDKTRNVETAGQECDARQEKRAQENQAFSQYQGAQSAGTAQSMPDTKSTGALSGGFSPAPSASPHPDSLAGAMHRSLRHVQAQVSTLTAGRDFLMAHPEFDEFIRLIRIGAISF